MKTKKLLSLLLVLIMCAGLVPTYTLAAGDKTIVINTDGVENGTVEIVSIPDGATQDGNKISGLTAQTSFVTIKATPDEGYEFLNWTARFSANNGKSWLPKLTAATYVLKSGQTFGSNPLEIAPGKMGSASAITILELTPNFGKPLKLAVESSNPEMGEVVLGPNTSKQLTEKTDKGYVGSYTAGNVEIGYRLNDSEKYQFVGWAIRYTNGESGITEDLDNYHYYDLSMLETTTWPYGKNPWNTDETVVGNTIRDLIDTNKKGIKYDATITAVFNDKTSPNYTLADDSWNIKMYVISQDSIQSIYSSDITGWDNTTNEVVAEFECAVTAAELKDAKEYYINLPIGKDGKTIRTAPGLTLSFTDENHNYTYSIGDAQGFGPNSYNISDFADVYEIHFNVLDNNGNTKPGVIRLKLKNRGLLTTEHGTVQYLGKQYENGSVMDFITDGDGEATVTAVPEAGYKLLKWVIDGTEYPANGNDITFAVPDSTFDIQAVFAAPEFVVDGKTPRFDIRDDLLSISPLVSLATEGTVTGWSNDTDELAVVTFNNVGTLPKYLAVYSKLNDESYTAEGITFSFDGRTTEEKGSWLSWSRYYYTELNADDYQIGFTITDKNGFVKHGVIRFERDGNAGIETEHGSVIYNDTEYTDGQTIAVATGDITLQAKADEGYAFAGWEIGGKEYSDNPLTIETDGKFFIIKAKFAKLVTVSVGEAIGAEGTAKFTDDDTAGSKTVIAGESVSISAIPGEKSKFVVWYVEYEKAEGKFMPAEEGRHYILNDGTSLSDGTLTFVTTKEYNLKVYPKFEPTYSVTLQQTEGGKASFVEPINAMGNETVSGLTKDSAAVTWECEIDSGYKFDKWNIEYFDSTKNVWTADPTTSGSTAIYRYWTPVDGDGRYNTSMSVKVTEYDLRITPQISKGYTVEAVADPEVGGTVEVTGSYNGYFYKDGNANATLKATAAEGYSFVGWTAEYKQEDGTYAPAEAGTHYRNIAGSLDTKETTVTVLEYSLRFTAKFSKQLYVELAQTDGGNAEFVEATPDENGRVWGDDDNQYKTVAKIKATPENGYRFVEWTITDAKTDDTITNLQHYHFTEGDEKTAQIGLCFSLDSSDTARHVNLKVTPKFAKLVEQTITIKQPEVGGKVELLGENAGKDFVTVLDDYSGTAITEILATADEGYCFTGWRITNTDTGENVNTLCYTQTNVTEDGSQIEIGFSKSADEENHVNLTLEPVFAMQLNVIIESSNEAYGTVTPAGENKVAPGGTLSFSATPVEDSLFMGWEVIYADGSEVTNKGDVFSITTNTSDHDSVGDINTIKLYDCTKDIKLIAHFVKKTEPNFARYNTVASEQGTMAVPRFGIAKNPALYSSSVTGWNNDLSEKIVVTFDSAAEAGTVGIFYRYKYSDLTAAGVTFDMGEGTSDWEHNSASTRKYAFDLTEEQAAALYELPFTATDANGNVKQGVMRFKPARRAAIEAENGVVKYGETEYESGKAIDFPAGSATITAVANEGYAFAGWEIEGVTLTDEQIKAETVTFTVPEQFFTIKAKFEVDSTSGIKVTLMSENAAKGSVSAITEGLDSFKPNGTKIIELSATPANDCTLVGWTVTETASGEYLDKSLYTLYEEGENKLLLAKNVDKDVTVTAYFANSTEGVFVMPGERLPIFTITGKDGTVYTGTIENWDNNTYKEIVVTFSGFGTSDIIGQDMFITLSNGSSDVLAPTDLVMKRTDAGDGKEEVVRHEDGGKVYYSLSDYQRESAIPFTFTDRNGNVKKGTIKLNLDYRAEVYIVGFCQPMGSNLGGYVLYNGNKYYSGSVIQFEPDPDGYVTITAVPDENSLNIKYVFKNWNMDTVELTDEQVYANPLKFKPAKDYGVIQPQFARDGRLVVVTDAENGKAEFKKNGELVEGGEAAGIAYGTDELSVKAIPDDGYVFVRWQVEMAYSITEPDSWVGEKYSEEEQARLLASGTSLSESDIRTAELNFTLEGGNRELRLTPLFGQDVKGVTITLDNSESEKGTVSSEDDLTDVRWYLPAVTIKAEKKDGYEFHGWIVTSTATGKSLYNGKDYEMVEVDEYTMTIRPLSGSTQDMTVKGNFIEYQPVHGTVKGHGYAVVYEGMEYREGDVITFPNGKGTATLEWKPDNANTHFVSWFFSDYVMNNESEARKQPKIDVQLSERDFEINVVMGYKVNYRIMCDGEDITYSDDWANATGTRVYTLQGLYGYDISKYPTIDDAIDNYSEISGGFGSSYVVPGDGVICYFDENFRLGGNVLNGRVKYVYDSVTTEPAADEIGVAKRLIDKKYSGYEDKNDEYRVWAAYVMPESDITIVINIRRVSYSQITVQPNNTAYGSVSVSPQSTAGDGYYKEGTYLRINAVAKSGYRFVKWEEAQGSSYLSEEQKLNSNLSIKVGVDYAMLTAVFEADPKPVAQALNLTVDPTDKANVLVNGAKDVNGAFEGESITVSLGDLDDYYEFDHWEITRDSSGESLISGAESFMETITFVMPNGSVTVKAVLSERTISVAWRYLMKQGDNVYTSSSVSTPYMADMSIWKNGELQNPNSGITVVKGDTISFEVKLKDPNKYILEKIWLSTPDTMMKIYDDYKGEYTVTDWKYEGKAIYQILINVGFDINNGKIQRYNLNVVQPASGGTIECDSVYPLANSVITLTAKPEENYRLKRWIVTDEYNNAVEVTVSDDDANSAGFTMPAADVTVTAEFEQTDASGAEILSVDILSSKGGAVIASGSSAGDAWTVELGGVIDKTTADGIPQGTSGLYMRIITNDGTTVEQVNAFTGDWSKGDIACYMPLNQGVIFIAHNGEQSRNYTITLSYSEPGAPELSNGFAERVSDKEANIKFTASEGGSCYYAVVVSGAAEPVINTEGKGMSISVGENTLTLTNLAKGARDIYIVVKNANGVASKPMKIEIPAFGSGESDGEYTISVAEHVGGTLTPDRTRANEGDEVSVSISAAEGMRMKEGSLTYTEAVEDGKTVAIENGKFTMPACNVTISCQWESAASMPTGGGITEFVIDGIHGAIDAGGNIVVTMPYNTDVTALRPMITGMNISKIAPASGETVDFTKPVIYTVTLTDGTVKLYTVTVQLQNAGVADELWDKLTDPGQTLPWWKYAEQQQSHGKYPRYW